MENLKLFFFDTYALHEIVHESKNYNQYIKKITLITTKLNLMELHYTLLRNYNLEYANQSFEYFKKFCIDFDDETIKQANEFRLKNYKRELSYIDCLGYILAKKNNAKFLTGDEQFEDFENVEYVK